MLCLLTFLTIYIIPSYHWVELPSPGLRAYEHTVVYDPAGDLFFIMGGDSTGSYTNMDICLEFDPKTNTWDTKASMFSQKRGHSASYRKGFIHVVCGTHNYDNRISEHEVYNIQSDSWSLAADAPIPVRNPSLVTWRDSILYIMGGYDSTHTARTEVYYYTPSTNSWDSATSLPRPLHGGGAKIKGDTIFIIGGADGMTAYSDILFGEINPADPSSINWQWGEPLPLPSNQYNNGLAIKNNKAYMVGGLYNDGTNQVWEYDIPGETWTQLPDYPTSIIIRGEFAATRDVEDSLGGEIYCFMGDTTDFYYKTPTDECYKLMRLDIPPGIEEKKKPERNSISLKSTICLSNDITIDFNIVENCDVKVRMYDVLGREVFSLLEKNVVIGHHQLDIRENFENGIYFIKIETGETVKKAKVILIR